MKEKKTYDFRNPEVNNWIMQFILDHNRRLARKREKSLHFAKKGNANENSIKIDIDVSSQSKKPKQSGKPI